MTRAARPMPPSPVPDCACCAKPGGCLYNWTCRACRVRYLARLPTAGRRAVLRQIRDSQGVAEARAVRAEIDQLLHRSTLAESLASKPPDLRADVALLIGNQ